MDGAALQEKDEEEEGASAGPLTKAGKKKKPKVSGSF